MIWRALGVLSLLGLVATSGSAELTAVITQLEDGVQAVKLEAPGMSRAPAPKLWQVLRAGSVLKVPQGAAAGVVCSTPSFVPIAGPASWRFSEENCAKGKPLTKAQYSLVVPRGGRFKLIRDLWVFEREMRGDGREDPLAPLILSPRNTAVRSLRPSILWLRVPSAIEYQARWSGRGADDFTLRLDADAVPCAAGWGGLEVCKLAWPPERPDLPPGRTFFLTLAARADVAESWHQAEEVRVHTLAAEEAELLERRLSDLDGLGLTSAAREVAQAGVLAGAGLYAESAEIYMRAAELSPAAALEITLADIHLATGLHRLACTRYREALENEDPAVRAAAAFGYGRIEYSRARYREAALRFRQARELYATAGLSEEQGAALQAAKEAELRIPK